ncbi:hypothetical protein ACFYW1_16875 [Streptomyces sp. NPDC002669]|uniref:hypothetical protein n=1 Tax=Streptomyces sp. NPDC002669 TaxID=3364658 RepID=UPI0036B36461
MDLSFYKSFMSEEIRDESRAKGLAESVLLVLQARGIAVTDELRERIGSCGDSRLLLQWLNRAATATTADEVFTEG